MSRVRGTGMTYKYISLKVDTFESSQGNAFARLC